jgi:hypothetical protein
VPVAFPQEAYSSRLWHKDPVICALGAPALGVDLAGPNLLIRGALGARAFNMHTGTVYLSVKK